jgi:hypothetical protein
VIDFVKESPPDVKRFQGCFVTNQMIKVSKIYEHNLSWWIVFRGVGPSGWDYSAENDILAITRIFDNDNRTARRSSLKQRSGARRSFGCDLRAYLQRAISIKCQLVPCSDRPEFVGEFLSSRLR